VNKMVPSDLLECKLAGSLWPGYGWGGVEEGTVGVKIVRGGVNF
jgi:hypothetical protein